MESWNNTEQHYEQRDLYCKQIKIESAWLVDWI